MKKLLLIAIFGMLLFSCGNNEDEKTPSNSKKDNTPYAEGTDEYIYSINRLKSANYDFSLDFKEEDTRSIQRTKRNVFSRAVTDTTGYDISSMDGYHYNLFSDTQNYLEMNSTSAKMFVDQYVQQVKVLNKAIELVPEEHHGGGEVEIVPPEEHHENELLPRLDIQKNMAMVSFDEETDEVYLVVHDKFGGVSSVRLSTNERGIETVEYYSCSINNRINYTVYTPNYLCHYLSMEPAQEYIDDGPVGYMIHETYFQQFPGSMSNWIGYSYNGFLSVEALAKEELELSDLMRGDIEYFYSSSSSHFEVGVSHRLHQYEEGDDIPEGKEVGDYDLICKRTQSGFASYLYQQMDFGYYVSEFDGFETVYTKTNEYAQHVVNEENEFYQMTLGEDDYIQMTNGKTMYPGMLRINTDGTEMYPYVWDGQPMGDYDLSLGFDFVLFKGYYPEKDVVYDDFNIINTMHATVFCYSDKAYQNINNVVNLFKYYGITLKDDYYGPNAFNYFIKLVKDPSPICEYAEYYSDGYSPEGYCRLIDSTRKNAFSMQDAILHFFDNKEVVLSTELSDIPNVQLTTLSGNPVLNVSANALSLEDISFSVNKNRLFNDGNEYTVVLMMNNKMLDASAFNKVIYNGSVMSFTSISDFSYLLPTLEGKYSFSLVLAKVVEGGYVPVSNYLSVSISDIASFQKDTEDENIKLYYEVSNDTLIISQINLSPEVDE